MGGGGKYVEPDTKSNSGEIIIVPRNFIIFYELPVQKIIYLISSSWFFFIFKKQKTTWNL